MEQQVSPQHDSFIEQQVSPQHDSFIEQAWSSQHTVWPNPVQKESPLVLSQHVDPVSQHESPQHGAPALQQSEPQQVMDMPQAWPSSQHWSSVVANSPQNGLPEAPEQQGVSDEQHPRVAWRVVGWWRGVVGRNL